MKVGYLIYCYIICAFLVSLIVNLLTIYFSKNYNFFIDNSSEDKPQNFHTNDTPRAGGIGIFAGIFFILIFPFGVKILISSILAFISGIFEDFHNSLSPKLRLLLQTIAAVFVIIFANAIVTYFGLSVKLPYILGFIISLLGIVGMMNAINIIDGFNGLASGIVLLILSSFLYVSSNIGDGDIFKISAIAIGSILGFFVLNFPKGRIFLGDGGAYLLGFLIAVIGIFLAGNYESVSPWYIITLFIYPIWEVTFSIIRKKIWNQSPLEPDRYHLHMLVYRQFTKNNPLTGLVVNIVYSPFIVFATMHYAESLTNILISLLFISLYTLIYINLLKSDRVEKN